MVGWSSRANDIFVRAAEIAPAERQLFLKQQCGGDADLQAKVESLLATAGEAGSFLEKPAAPALAVQAATAANPPLTEGPGTVIGPYKLLQHLGEGGMGVVYMAEQQEPVRRKVALKIIKPGMYSSQVLARFEAERQALALMDHPNIAKVLDAGATQGEPGGVSPGRPYFVMELVKGVPITEFCDKNRLTTRQRLELFIPVCHAIQHAHMKGIIHRDVKPSNVLTALYDGKPVPKVIDFGVAKAMAEPLTKRTMFTQVGQIVGTFEYMSPEQATLNQLDIDTRSDVYSLGVLLYELLTGVTPLDKDRLRQLALDQMLQTIREEEAMRPSARLSSEAGALATAAAYRGTDSAKLAGLLRGELDWIVMKCLEKERDRRFITAGNLAQDVERYLRDEPVEACPPTIGYRVRKFARKNKSLLATAAAFAALLLLGVAASTWQAVRATQAEADALAERNNAEIARRSEMQQRAVAEEEAAAARTSEQKAKEAGDEALRLAGDEKAARQLADEQRLQALSEKEQADQARHQAKDSETKAEWRLYAMQIASAQREWETNNIDLLYHHLGQCRPDFRGWEHDYLYTLTNQYRQRLPEAGRNLISGRMAFSADGTRLAVAEGVYGASGPRTLEVQVWDLASGKVVLTLKDTSGFVKFSPDGKYLASAWFDKDKWGQDGPFSYPLDVRVKVWDAISGREIFSLRRHSGTRAFVEFSPDGKRLAVGDGTIKLWDIETGKELRPFELSEVKLREVTSVAFSSNGKQLASVAREGVTVWDLTSGKELVHFKGHKELRYSTVAFSPDGKHLAGTSRVGTLMVWELPGGREVLTLPRSALFFAFTPDGKRLVGGGGLGSTAVKVWEFPGGRELFTVKGPTGQLAFSPDGKQLASLDLGRGHLDGVRIWELAASQDCLTLLAGPKRVATGLAFSPDGKLLAGPSGDNTVKLWQAADGREIRTFTGHTDVARSVAFSPNGKQLASASEDKTVKLWDAASGKEIRTFEGHTSRVVGVAFSPDGRYLASAEASGRIENRLRVWELASGKEVLTINGTWGALAFSPDSKFLATAFNDMVRVLDLASGKEIMTGKGHASGSYGIRCVVFSPDGQRLASASRDGTVKVWDLATGKDLMTLKGHTSQVECVAFSPDGKRLASGSDNTVKLWDAASGQEVFTLKGHTAAVHCVTFSPDGKRLASASEDSTIKIWDATKSIKEPGQK